MKSIIKYKTHYSVKDYHIGDFPKLERYFCVYNKVTHKYESLAIIYDKESRELRFPGGANEYAVRALSGSFIEYDNSYDVYDNISIRITIPPRNELQKDMVKFLIGEGDYKWNKNCSQLACNAETGEGKTYAAISNMTYMRCRMLVVVNRKNIKENWINEICKFTDIDKARVLDVDSSIIIDIVEGKIDPSKYYAFVVIHRTIQRVASTHGWKYISKFFELIRIGLKVYDEANMEFANSVFIDCFTNTYRTLYLTANMEKSAVEDNIVFQNCFKGVPKFDQYKLGYTESKRHIIMIAILYDSHPSYEDQKMCMNGLYGFNPKSYSEYQVTEDDKFFEVVRTTVEKFTVNNNMRSLVLVSKIKACSIVADFIKKEFPDIEVGIYNSSISKKDKEYVLENSKLIVSTIQSLGFSETITGLRFVLNCEAFRFKATGNQASGRLRRLFTGDDCYYAEIVDEGFSSIRSQFRSRIKYYKKLFKEIIKLEI